MDENGNSIFLPGERPGPVAGGTDQDGSTVTREAQALRMKGVPTGSEVSRKFPWMRRVTWTIAAEKRVLKRANFGETFVNSSPRRVNVEEVRFQIDGFPGDTRIETEIFVKMSIAAKKEIIGEWMPWHVLQTEMDRFLVGYVNSYCYKLPAPYFLQRGSVFVMDVELPDNRTVSAGDRLFYMSLHGKGAEDGEPIDLCKPVEWTTTQGTANNIISIPFDEERDMPLRDAWIEQISFGAAASADDSNGKEFSQTRVRPRAPDGPRWHDDELFEIGMLAEQVGTIPSTNYATKRNPCVIHRPIVPYVLEPGDIFQIEVWDQYTGQLVAEELRVALLGTQEPI